LKESYLYKQLANNNTQCLACNHYCQIAPNKFGVCGVRQNIDGKLYLLTYARACWQKIEPISLSHYLPNSQTMAVATAGCNFSCNWCNNYDASQSLKDSSLRNNIGKDDFQLIPYKIVSDAVKNQCKSISFSYSEPTVYLEYAHDIMKLAKKEKLKNIWETNGYMSNEALELILSEIDAANVDIKIVDKNKFIKYTGASSPEKVLENCQKIVKKGLHLEVTTLIVPTVNDDAEELTAIAEFIHNKLGSDIVWHILKYHPAYRMFISPTSKEKLELAYSIGKKVGLRYVVIEEK